MADIAHVVGSDLTIGPTGDLAIVVLAEWTQQRILRRLLTNAGGYIWQLSYGASLPAAIGQTISTQQVAAVIRRQLRLESAVAQFPEPSIMLGADQAGTVFATITYRDAQTDTVQNLHVTGAL